jgi:chloramphenicol-sensitive protein RarD
VFYTLFLAAGHLPWIALVLAGSFTAYGYLRKVMAADSLTGLTAETCLLLPLAIVGVIWFWAFEGTAFGTHIGAELSSFNILLLVGSGPVTAAPLLLFAAGARRLPLSTMGFLQYLAPSLMFIISVVLFHEALTPAALITFLFHLERYRPLYIGQHPQAAGRQSTHLIDNGALNHPTTGTQTLAFLFCAKR